jgi:DNA invertase Pin-like site-specific DNA recombinase/uncharacterized coiled-coil protein SlyX
VKRAFSYERVSCSKQAQGGGGLDRQSTAAASWCLSNGYELDQELDLSDPGRSAFHGHHLSRGALGQFLALAQAGLLGTHPVLLVEAIDRLSRQEPLDALETILQGLLGTGVQVVTLEDGATYSRRTLRDDPTKLILLVLKVQAAHEYSARLSRRMQASWQQIRERASEGKNRSGARRPFWIDYDAKTDSFRLNDKAEIIRRMYELIEAGNGISLVCRNLNAEGFSTPMGKPWNPSNLRWVLRTELAYGTATFLRSSETPLKVANYYPAVISQERYEAAHRLRRSRSKDRSLLGRKDQVRWIGQGISRCTCGSSMAAYGSRGRFYLQCKRARYKPEKGSGAICPQGMIQLRPTLAHVLARFTIHQLQTLFDSSGQAAKELRSQIKAREALAAQLDAAKTEAARAETKVKEAAKAGVELSLLTLLNDAVVEARQRVDETQQALEQVLSRLDLLQARPSAADAAKQLSPAVDDLLRSAIRGTDTVEQRSSLNTLLRKLQITIHVDARGKRCGLQVRDGDIAWQPVIEGAGAFALRQGSKAVGGQFLGIEDPELARMIGEGNSVSLRLDDQGNSVVIVLDAGGTVIRELSKPPSAT